MSTLEHEAPGKSPSPKVPRAAPSSSPAPRTPRVEALRGMDFQAGTEALRPATATAPGPKGTRMQAERRLNRWYADAGNAVQDLRNQMGRAGERFSEFAGGGVKKLKAVVSTAGNLAGLVFGTAGKAAALLANLLVDVAAKSPTSGIQAGLAMRLDNEKSAGDAEVRKRYEGFAEALDRATTPGQEGKLLASIEQARILPTPDENILYRDLLLQFVDDRGMHLDGSEWQERNLGKYYMSWDFGNPIGTDGHDVAKELNKLGRVDPSTRMPFRSQERP